MLAMRRFQQPNGARNAGRSSADDRIDELQRLAVVAQKALGRRSGRRSLASIVRDELVRGAVVREQKRAAAQAR